VSLAGPELRIRRFTVSELRRMRTAGVLPAQARVELLEGVLVDVPRPSARKIAVIRRLADLVAEQLGAPVHEGEPIHPDAYATFDPEIMVHDWETLPATAPYRLHRFSIEEYHRLADVGILSTPNRYELLDGVVLEVARPLQYRQRRIHRIARVLRGSGLGAVRVLEPVRLGPYSLPRIDLALCRERLDRSQPAPPTGEEVQLAVDLVDELSDVTQSLDWPVYARWGIQTAWLVDLRRGEVHIGREPSRRGYARVTTCRQGDRLEPHPALPDLAVAVGDLLG
jgi:Uma2 family endonuclease